MSKDTMVSCSYNWGKVEILKQLADRLNEIIEEEENNLKSYYFGIQEHNELLNRLKRLVKAIQDEIGLIESNVWKSVTETYLNRQK